MARKIIDSFFGFFRPKKGLPPKPEAVAPKVEVEAVAKPSKKAVDPKPKTVEKDDPKLVCTLQNEDSKSVAIIKELKAKTRRRALRHFAGKEVRHRVTEKKPDSIEFSFFRRSGKPVKIKWQKNGAQPERTP